MKLNEKCMKYSKCSRPINLFGSRGWIHGCCEVKNMPSILLHHIWAGLGRYFSYILYPISPKSFPNEFLDEHERIDVNFFMNDCFIYVSSYFLFQRGRCYHNIRLHFIFTLNVLTVAQTCFITIFLNGITGHK